MQELANNDQIARKWLGKLSRLNPATEAEFLGNDTLCFAVAQRLTVIGEAAGRLSRDVRREHAEIPWADIIALRNILVHEYFGIKPSAVSRPSTAQLVAMLQSAGFGRVDHELVIYTDSVDGSLHALHTSALHLAGPAYLRNTSFWMGLDDDTRRAGLAALARDLRSGLLEERVGVHFAQAAVQGHETVFAAWP